MSKENEQLELPQKLIERVIIKSLGNGKTMEQTLEEMIKKAIENPNFIKWIESRK